MGYYCTVPQCTSLAGKTKNVKFHRFPRDVTMADKWNAILKRGKPYTKYSKVCSLHFTQADYNVTTMGQWKTLSKDAVPSQNLPKLHADGTVMVIRKSRTVKYREPKKEEITSEKDKWLMSAPAHPTPLAADQPDPQDINLNFRLHTLSAIASSAPHHPAPPPHAHPHAPAPHLPAPLKPKKQDAIMQTDPVAADEDDASEGAEPEPPGYPYPKPIDPYEPKKYDAPKDYTKAEEDYIPQTNEEYNSEAEKYALERKAHSQYEKTLSPVDAPKDYTKAEEDYIPQTNEEYNSEAEKYALERKAHSQYEKVDTYPKSVPMDSYPKMDLYPTFGDKAYPNRADNWYQNGYQDSVEHLRNQQHNLQLLQQTRDTNLFDESHIKRELEPDEEKAFYERGKHMDGGAYGAGRRLMEQLSHQVKQEPDATVGDNVMQPQGSPYYSNGHNATGEYYGAARPGAELLIAKQNALAAHTQLWQNTMKRPFFYSEQHYNSPPLLHRYEDISRILQ